MLTSIRGISLYELHVGTGPLLPILHGGPGASHDYLRPGFDAIGAGRTLIYYDQRGGGQSPVPREVPVGWREHVADLEALRIEWGLERIPLVGYSWGGLLAMLYATEHPDRVAYLVLVSPAPAWKVAREEFERRFSERTMSPDLQAARAELRASGLRERDPAAHQQRLFELSVAGYFHDPARASELTPFRVVGRTQKEVWESLGEYDLRPALRGLSVPACVLIGDDDPIPPESAREAADCLGAEFHLLPACGHVPYVEALEPMTRIVTTFINGQQPTANSQQPIANSQ